MDKIQIFEDTLKQCESNPLLISAIKNSIKGTVLYKQGDTPEVQAKTGDCKITVTQERTFESAKNLLGEYPDSKIGVLNFASAKNVGGGVVRGASAQEECLCRCSTLYPCLDTDYLFENYYQMHRSLKELTYTDACIYTPDITVIKSDTNFPESVPENERFSVDVLTCPAPNAYNPIPDDKLLEIHKRRGRHIISIAVKNNIDVLVLGAFGCGAFRNNPEIVARAYKEIIPQFTGYFKEIRFAVYCSPRNTTNYDVFRRIING
ncbi:MAG: TIGR02452 family protein [Lachnospiraceae bacterium]|nr:TIGR02452 family protein [Lachnospiraceae bacterium]MCM1230364.1 TIGR02452 family protein [Ruminococcus flavefaciens]